MARAARDVDNSTAPLAPELVAIITALAKEQARRDHYAEQARAGAERDRAA